LLLESVSAAPLGKGKPSAAVDDPVPGQKGAGRKIAQDLTHQPGAAGQAGKFGYLAVGGDLAPRNLGHDMPNFFLVDAHAR